MDEHEQRVRDRAYRLWQEEGCPGGRAEAHWDIARELVAQEENQSLTAKPVAEETARPAGAEPVEIPEMVEKQADVPNLTDRGDKPAYPKRAVAARRRTQTKR